MKTLEEFVIKEIQDLRKKVETLEMQNQELNCIIDKQNEEYLENKAFIKLLKEDFGCTIIKGSLDSDYITFNNSVWSSKRDNTKFDYYKQKLELDTYDDHI